MPPSSPSPKPLSLAPARSFNERLIAAFMLGLALFMPPLLAVFARGSVAGVPVLFLYLFGAWIGLTVALALIIERAGSGVRRPPADPDGNGG